MATSEGFTEGEWIAKGDSLWLNYSEEPANYQILGVAYGGPRFSSGISKAEAIANARLWAASKKLLASLQVMVQPIWEPTITDVKAARAAIAAALGQEEATS